jgi:hypothetical protein
MRELIEAVLDFLDEVDTGEYNDPAAEALLVDLHGVLMHHYVLHRRSFK